MAGAHQMGRAHAAHVRGRWVKAWRRAGRRVAARPLPLARGRFSLATPWQAVPESGTDDGLIRAVEGEGAERVGERALR
jgi:hypothetical protein